MLIHETPSRPIRKNNNYSRSKAGASKAPRTLKGSFLQGVWHCDCSPALPAERFQVKKEGKNKGKWFYTCQNSNKRPDEEKGCKFFLWAEDAQLREQAAVLGNSRSEPRTPVKPQIDSRGIFKHVPHDPSIEADFALSNLEDSSTDDEFSSSPSKKRTADMADLDARAARSATRGSMMETPRKAPKLSGMPMTPDPTADTDRTVKLALDGATPIAPLQLKNSRLEELLTPRTPRTINLFPTLPVEPQSAAELLAAEAVATPTKQMIDPLAEPPGAPQISRGANSERDPDTSNSKLVAKVFAELADIKIPPDVAKNLRSILSIYEMQAEGVKKARDLVRMSVNKKETENQRLHSRIRDLEAQVAKYGANLLSEIQRPSGASLRS